jgi:hypothetical protein
MAEDVPVDLSAEQASELMKLRAIYSNAIGHNISDPTVWFGNHINNYLSALALDATIDAHGLQMQKSTHTRRDTLHVSGNQKLLSSGQVEMVG